jgi:acetolactate synthase I/II/III large subunit
MTIAAYWAWSCWDARTGAFHSAQGAGGIGWAYGAGLGGAVGLGRRVLVVSGDGWAMYSIGELAVARQHNLPVTWLIIDDGGYGILCEHMAQALGAATATELARPNFVALSAAFSVPHVSRRRTAWRRCSRSRGRRTVPTSLCCPRGSRCSRRPTCPELQPGQPT